MKIITGLNAYGFNTAKKTIDIMIDDNDNGEIIVNHGAPIEATLLDGNNQHAIFPGWFDTHIHGHSGHDFANDDLTMAALDNIVNSLGCQGVSYCMPTFVSLSLENIKRNLTILDNFIAKQTRDGAKPGCAQLLGVHLEGPFIAQNCKGAHDENVLQKKISLDIFIELVRAAPHIDAWKITLAPELDGAIQFISDTRKLSVDGRLLSVNVFIGHTNADTLYLEQAFQAGAIGFTHLGNANCETAHRLLSHITHTSLESNVVKYALNEKNKTANVYFELITDGYHLSKTFVNFAVTGRENKIILVTDALAPTGLSDNEYSLGTLSIEKKGERCYLKNTDKLAGSAAQFATIVEKFSAMINKTGHDLWEILYHATIANPRQTTLAPHTRLNDNKNFIIINQQGKLILSTCNGKTIYHTDTFKRAAADKKD